jgi:hypothetical protein
MDYLACPSTGRCKCANITATIFFSISVFKKLTPSTLFIFARTTTSCPATFLFRLTCRGAIAMPLRSFQKVFASFFVSIIFSLFASYAFLWYTFT